MDSEYFILFYWCIPSFINDEVNEPNWWNYLKKKNPDNHIKEKHPFSFWSVDWSEFSGHTTTTG